FQGRRLNRPNDVVVKSDGAIYFTDPWTLQTPQEQWDLTFAGVYRLTPDVGTFTLLVDNFVLPNGLAFSPDESVLYINDSRRGHIRAFNVMPRGVLAKQSDRVFADLRGSEPGVPDGMKPLIITPLSVEAEIRLALSSPGSSRNKAAGRSRAPTAVRSSRSKPDSHSRNTIHSRSRNSPNRGSNSVATSTGTDCTHSARFGLGRGRSLQPRDCSWASPMPART